MVHLHDEVQRLQVIARNGGFSVKVNGIKVPSDDMLYQGRFISLCPISCRNRYDFCKFQSFFGFVGCLFHTIKVFSRQSDGRYGLKSISSCTKKSWIEVCWKFCIYGSVSWKCKSVFIGRGVLDTVQLAIFFEVIKSIRPSGKTFS